MRKIWMPIAAVVLAAVILLGLYNGLAGVREYNELHDLSEKASAMFPGNKVVSPETYTGEDSNIHRVWKVDTGWNFSFLRLKASFVFLSCLHYARIRA